MNGMTAVVVDVQQHSVVLRTRVGNIVTVFPYTDDEFEVMGELRRVTYLPLRLGYAITLQKVQGATLDHVTIWLDVANAGLCSTFSRPARRGLAIHRPRDPSPFHAGQRCIETLACAGSLRLPAVLCTDL